MSRKLQFRVAIPAFIFLIVLMFPFSYIHELGHASVCAAEGNTFEIMVNLNGGQMICHNEVENFTIYKMMGGTLAMVIASMPFLFYNKIKKYSFIVIAFGVLAIGHGLNAVIETMLFDSYIENTQTLAMMFGMINFFIFIALCLKFSKKEMRFTNVS